MVIGNRDRWTLNGVQTSSRERVFISGITTIADSSTTVFGVIRKPGVIKVFLPDSADHATGYVYIPGTSIVFIPGEARDFVLLDSVPAGIVPSVNYRRTSTSETQSLRLNTQVTPSDTAVIAKPGWLYARTIALNTSSSGADVSGIFTDYPVLVRLSSADFNFTEAAPGGGDIRFTKADGTTLLPYEIERWDAANGLAEVWVKMDTVRGSDSAQFFDMYWRRDNAAGMSLGSSVFGSTQGFLAVWHLGETANTDSGGYRDAGPAGVHATAVAPNVASDTEAVVGKGKRFEQQGGILLAPIPPGIGGNNSFSVMFWLNFRPPNTGVGVLTMGHGGTLQGFHFLIKADTMEQVGPWDATESQNLFSLAAYGNKWTHFATVYDSAAGTLKTFVNGNLAATNTAVTMNIQSTPGVYFGKGVVDTSTANLIGALDEVRIYGKTLTENALQLEYEIQKPGKEP